MRDCLAAPGMAEAERLYGRPEVRHYDLGDWGDLERFWTMWAKRRSEVVMAIRRPGGRVLLQTKAFYPEGAYRLPSGGIWQGEALLDAARRETLEETGLEVQVLRFLGALCYRFRRAGATQERASYVFLLDGGAGPLVPQDQVERISGYCEVPLAELDAVAARLEQLPGEWAVWGRFRALVHRFVLEVME